MLKIQIFILILSNYITIQSSKVFTFNTHKGSSKKLTSWVSVKVRRANQGEGNTKLRLIYNKEMLLHYLLYIDSIQYKLYTIYF